MELRGTRDTEWVELGGALSGRDNEWVELRGTRSGRDNEWVELRAAQSGRDTEWVELRRARPGFGFTGGGLRLTLEEGKLEDIVTCVA